MHQDDPEWIVKAFDDHYSAIYSFFARRVGVTVAEDLSSETFSIALARRHTFDAKRGTLVGWLYGIASNLISNHRRSEDRRLRAFAKERRTSATIMLEIPNDRLETADERRALVDALRKLRPIHRDVLLMSAWTDLSQDEIADALHIPLGTFKSRLSRARDEMRERLARCQPLSTPAERETQTWIS